MNTGEMGLREVMTASGAGEKIAQYARGSRNLAMSVVLYRGGEWASWRLSSEEGEGRPGTGNALRPGHDPRQYEIGSITKTFTASLLCKYLEEGKLSLSDRLSKFLPALPDDCPDPTLLQLASHTAGYGETLPGDGGVPFDPCDIPDIQSRNPFARYTEADVANMARRAKKEYAVKTPTYSNFGVSLLAWVLGQADGRGAAGALRGFIDEALALPGFSLGRPDGEYVTGASIEGEEKGNWLWTASPLVCMGGLYANAESLLGYARRQLANDPPYLQNAWAPRADGFQGPDQKTGLCWLLWPEDGIVWHSGGTGCFKTILALKKSADAAAIVLSNQKWRNDMTPEEIGRTLLRGL